MSVKGWTKREPYERALHYSERFENAVNYLAQRGTLPRFCEELGFTPDTFYERNRNCYHAQEYSTIERHRNAVGSVYWLAKPK